MNRRIRSHCTRKPHKTPIQKLININHNPCRSKFLASVFRSYRCYRVTLKKKTSRFLAFKWVMASKRWSFHLWCGWRFTGSSSCQKGGNCFSPVTPPTVALALRSLGQLFHWPARCRSSNYWGLKVELRNHPPPRGRATQAFLPSRTHQYSAGICILPRQNPNRGLCSNTYLVCQKRLQKDQNLLTKQNGHQFFLCSLCISSFICSPGHMLNNMHVLNILISVTGQDNMYDQQDLIATTSWCTP